MPDRPQAKDLFHAALQRPPDQRARFLREACGDDGSLRANVESLLDAHDRAGAFLADSAPDPGRSPARGERWVGRRVGAYRLTRVLGTGGMGPSCWGNGTTTSSPNRWP